MLPVTKYVISEPAAQGFTVTRPVDEPIHPSSRVSHDGISKVRNNDANPPTALQYSSTLCQNGIHFIRKKMLQCVDGINRFDRLFGERQAVAGIEPEIRLREGVDIDVRVTWNIPCSA